MSYQILEDPNLWVLIQIARPHWVGLTVTVLEKDVINPRYAFARYDGNDWYGIHNRTQQEIENGRAARLSKIQSTNDLIDFALEKFFGQGALVHLYFKLKDGPIWKVIQRDVERLFQVGLVMDS